MSQRAFVIDIHGCFTVVADTEAEAIAAAIDKIQDDAHNTLFIEAEEVPCCRFCGCTEDEACEEGCEWLEGATLVCTSAPCLEAYKNEIANQVEETEDGKETRNTIPA